MRACWCLGRQSLNVTACLSCTSKNPPLTCAERMPLRLTTTRMHAIKHCPMVTAPLRDHSSTGGRGRAYAGKHATRQHLRCQLCGARRLHAPSEKSAFRGAQLAAEADDSSAPGGDGVDIDALAARLSQEAERLRRSESGREASSSSRPSAYSDDPIFGAEALRRQAAFLARVEGGFVASEFELLQQLGRLSWVTESAKEDPLQLTATSTEQVQAVVAFAARYYSGGPFQDPVTALLKEFLPAARPVGCNELQISTALSGLPGFKWQAAAAGVAASPPVIPILGYFTARHSDTGAVLSQDGLQPSSALDALWLVYKWEPLQPLTFYPAAEQPRPGFQFWGGDAELEALRARCLMLRRIAQGAVAAVAFCHDKFVSHGSLGSGSVLLDTFEDRQAASLIVKLTNFGFAQQVDAAASTTAGVPEWQKDDLQAIGIVLLETIFSALAEGGPAPTTSADALKRLLLDVFGGQVDRFRLTLRILSELWVWHALPQAKIDGCKIVEAQPCRRCQAVTQAARGA